MAIQYSTTLRNTWLDDWETVVGALPTLELRTGAQPANCAAADSGTLLASIPLDSDWASAASAGSKTVTGVPETVAAAATGTVAHYRLKTSGGTVVEQGTVTVTGGGGDMTVDNTSITSGQNVSLTGWTKTAPGA